MDKKNLKKILDGLKDVTVTVIGDFFLDKYLMIDPDLDEPSLETGLTAYQVTGKELYPGAAGTVVKDLIAMGVGNVRCVGIIGRDGEGAELIAALTDLKADTSGLIATDKRQTCTYTKPVIRGRNGEKREINRLDLKNFTETPSDLTEELEIKLLHAIKKSRAVIAVDQLNERNYGVITDDIRDYLGRLKDEFPKVVMFGDSRGYISEYKNMVIKCNDTEAVRILKPDAGGGKPDAALVKECGLLFNKKTGRPVFITLGEDGMLVFDGECVHAPGIKVEGPVDICGAGDAATAGIVSALVMGAGTADAAALGNMAASVAVRQLGVTGSASPEQILELI